MTRAYTLATDARWPLDGGSAGALRELEIGMDGPVTLWRVPEGPRLYEIARAASASPTLVVAKARPTVPPDGWTGPVCWHVSAGCEAVFNVRGVDRTESVSAFAHAASGASDPGVFTIRGASLVILASIVSVLVIRSLRKRRRH